MQRSFASITNQALATASGKSNSRKRLMSAVHATAKSLGIDDSLRRNIQKEATGKASLTDMTLAEMGTVLDRLNRGQPRRGLGGSSARPHIGKVRALWWTLYWLGEVTSPSEAALDRFVQRQTGLSALRFLDYRHAHSVIEALKAMAARSGVRWPTQERLDELAQPYNPGLTMQRLDRHAVVEAIWDKLRERRAVIILSPYEFLRAVIGGSLNQWTWDERALDECIRILGKKLRSAMTREDTVE